MRGQKAQAADEFNRRGAIRGEIFAIGNARRRARRAGRNQPLAAAPDRLRFGSSEAGSSLDVAPISVSHAEASSAKRAGSTIERLRQRPLSSDLLLPVVFLTHKKTT